MEKITSFNVVGVDPSRFWVDGFGLWKEDDKVFEDDVLVTLTKEDAYWVALSTGQICFLHVDTEASQTNGFLLELPEDQLSVLFQEGKIGGYTVFTRRTKNGIPQSFTIVSQEEAKGLANYDLQPVYYEFVYVQR